MDARTWSTVAGGALLLAACASTPEQTVREGDEEIVVTAFDAVGKPDIFTPPGPLRVPLPVEGMRCTLANDKGTWTATTPAKVRVTRSEAPLVVDCAMEGYKPVHQVLECLSQEEREHHAQKVEVPFLILMAPLAIIAAPVAPQVALQAGTQVVIGTASIVASEATRTPRERVCTYGGVAPILWRQ